MLKAGKGAGGKSSAPANLKPPILTPPIEGDKTMLSYPWQAYFNALSRGMGATGIAGAPGVSGKTIVGATGISIQGQVGVTGVAPSANIDGGPASAVYLPGQVYNGGNA